jgi:hypothetical protein
MSGEGFVIDTPEGIAMWRLLSLRSMLKIEITTGMSHSRGSVMNAIRETGISQKRTKRGVFADINAYIVALLGPEADSKL